jgi:cysteinyl-tRNA synthetase
MDIRFYNTLTHQLEAFTPIDAPNVYMYNCGPTVYDYAHIGNFRAFVFADVLRRFLELTGHNVHQVMNITDVGHMTEDQLADGGGEDKMQLAARRMKEAKKSGKADVDNPDDPYQIARFFTQAFIEDAKALNLKIADEESTNMPRATAHVGDMQAMIHKLIGNGHAYVADDGAVYYSVESFPEYGRLSGNTLDKLRGGAGGRILDEHQKGKRHPADFLLWKPDKTHLMKWDSPWGEGYPGWHIECSAMATKLLGRDTIDIHTGGEDNIFPHHECEIAQTCGATGNPRFARHWMHTRFLLVEGAKMSKSKGNFYTVRDVLNGDATGSEVDPRVLRYELLKTHYRSNANFTSKGLEDSAKAVQRLQEAYLNLQHAVAYRQSSVSKPAFQQVSVKTDEGVLGDFIGALADDLNVSKALGVIFTWLKTNPPQTAESVAIFDRFNDVIQFGVSSDNASSGRGEVDDRGNLRVYTEALSPEAEAKARQVDDARAAKDYDTADRLRQELIDAGYDVKTTKDGTVATKRLA